MNEGAAEEGNCPCAGGDDGGIAWNDCCAGAYPLPGAEGYGDETDATPSIEEKTLAATSLCSRGAISGRGRLGTRILSTRGAVPCPPGVP